MKMKKLILYLFVFLNSLFSIANNQEKADSLLKILPNMTSDTAKINLLLHISETYRGFETTNALKYCMEAYNLAKKIDNDDKLYQSIIIRGLIYYRLGKNNEAINDFNSVIKNAHSESPAKGKAYVNIGNVYADMSKYDSSIISYNNAIKVYEKRNDKKYIANIKNNIGTIYNDLGEFEKAIFYYTEAQKINEDIGNIDGAAAATGNIGIIYYYQKNYDKAIEYFKKALNMQRKIGRMDKVANAINNLASIMSLTNQMDSAIKYFNEAKSIYKKMDYKSGMALMAQNTANIYFKTNKSEQGMKEMKSAIELYEEMNEPKGLGKCYKGIGKHYTEIKKYNIAIQNFLKAEAILVPLDIKYELKDLYDLIAFAYAENNDHKEAYNYLKKVIVLNDSIFNSDKNKVIADIQEKYDSEAKQKEIELQQIELEKEKEKVVYQSKQKIWLVIGLFLTIVLLLIAFRGYKQKQKSNQIITLQKSLVEEKSKEITDSINYAKRIQEAILPSSKLLNQLLKNGFVFYQPKDIVSGDFYWMENISLKNSPVENFRDGSGGGAENIIYFAAADCTGHGVPGAMVSVVCSNALSKSVLEENKTLPGELLDKTREIVVNRFSKNNEDVKDGMDISLCSLKFSESDQLADSESYATLQYAGANNPLWVVRKGELIETKPNKQPIGKTDNPRPFTTHTIELQKGDTIYIFTDGFADQFGGEKGKKFMYKPFKELLLSIQDKTMDEQKEFLNQTFEKWKGSLEQVDDVCIIGVRI